MSVERIERKAERFGPELFFCDVSKHVQICNYIDEGQMQWKTTDAASASMTAHGLRNS
jgi:hypothetical protein